MADETKKLSREETIEELVVAFIENNDIRDIAQKGLDHVGFYNLTDKELIAEYEYHFGDEIELINL